MPVDDLFDVTLDGQPYLLVPGGYTRAAERAGRAEAQRQQWARFGAGLMVAQDDEAGEQGGGWIGDTVRAIGDGAGLEPWPLSATHADGNLVDLPSTTVRAYGGTAGSNVFIGIGRRIYKSVALTAGSWSSLTAAADLGAGFTISGLAYYQDDFLVMVGSGNDIRKFNTTTSALSVWRSGEKGTVGVGFKSQLVYAPKLANSLEELRLSITKWNGNAVTAFRALDNAIVTMGLYDAEPVIATKTSLYRMGGDPYPGEQDDASVTADTSKAPAWQGDPEPLMTFTGFATGDDFTFLLQFQGKLYTWVSGRVAELDEGAGVWKPLGPSGRACYGACVAAGYLVVATETVAGGAELWAFDGTGWWRILTGAAGTILWPTALSGAGSYDLLVFSSGSATYRLFRLQPRSLTVPAYASSGSWTSPLLTGGDAGTDKSWRRVDAWFAWPEIPGNPASGDSVTIALEYSVDAGTTWTQIDSESVTVGREQHLSHEFATPPVSRLLQLRVPWSSVSDWAPVLTHLDVDYAALDNAPRRQQWELAVRVPDQLAGSGRAQIDALWDAWRAQTSVAFRDLDYAANPVERQVRVLDVREEAPKPAAGEEWTGGVVTLTLAEL